MELPCDAILLATLEGRLREWLLDLLHSQWRALGVPLAAARRGEPNEVIDPEALLWCSLEFFPAEPRLCEQILNWLARSEQSILRPRIRKFAQVPNDPRASIWRALDGQWKAGLKRPPSACYGQNSVEELLEFCRRLEQKVQAPRPPRHQPGRPERTPATVILRARDALGGDGRHLLLVYLLASRGGAKLRSVAAWAGQSYRNIYKIAQRWQAADILTLDHGYARLKNPSHWTTILELGSAQIVLLDWRRLFDACIRLLRSLAGAAAKSLPADGDIVTGLIRETLAEAEASVEGDPSAPSETLRSLKDLFASGLS